MVALISHFTPHNNPGWGGGRLGSNGVTNLTTAAICVTTAAGKVIKWSTSHLAT